MTETGNTQNGALKNSSDILFLMDATLTNPNGDPYENIPRHYRTEQGNIGEITGVCLGQTIRSYLKKIVVDGKTLRVFVDREGDVLTAGETFEKFAKSLEDLTKNENATATAVGSFLKEFIDVRLFGALVTVKDKGSVQKKLKEIGIELPQNSIQKTGPVQLGALGKSIHPIALQKVPITTAFRSKEGQEGEKEQEQGTRGEKWVINYGLYQFTPVIDATLAAKTKMSKSDKDLFTEALWCGVKTRVSGSKANQLPLLYLEIVYRKGVKGRLGRLSDFVAYTYPSEPQQVHDIKIDETKLLEVIEKHKGHIEKALVIEDQDRLNIGLAAKLKQKGIPVEKGCSVTGKFGIQLESASPSSGK